jgi:hypothetical protein
MNLLNSVFTSLNLHAIGYFLYCTNASTQHMDGWFGYVAEGAFT